MIRCSRAGKRVPSSLLIRGIASRARRTNIASLLDRAPDERRPIEVAGWIRTIRKQKRVAFVSIQDGSTIDAAQVVLSPEQAAPSVNRELPRCAIR